MNSKKIKCYMVGGGAIVLALSFSMLFLLPSTTEDDYFSYYKKNMIMVTDQVESEIKLYKLKVEKGLISEEKAKDEAVEWLKKARYGESGYFWLMSSDQNKIIMHPYFREIEGQNVIDVTNKIGAPVGAVILQEINDNEEGFVSYQWPRENEETLSNKISYLRKLPYWNWTLGTGFYLEDLQAMVHNDYVASQRTMLVLSLLLMITLMCIAYATLRGQDKGCFH